MKSSIGYLIRRLGSLIGGALILLICLSFNAQVSAQEYATSTTSSSVNGSVVVLLVTITAPASVTDKDNASGAADGNYAILRASGIKATDAITISGNATLTMNLPANVAAGKHSFVKIKAPEVTGLLDLDLGDLVNVLGLLENNTIQVTTNAGTARSRLVRDGANNLFIEVTSSAAYNSISVKLDFANSTGFLGIGLGGIQLEIDNVVTYENAGLTACDIIPLRYVGVNPEATGIDLTLTEALQDPNRAIDGIISTSNYALLQNGNVGAVSTVHLNYYIGQTVPGTNQFIAYLSRPALLLDVTVLSGIVIQAYNGSSVAGAPRILSNLLLGLSLLDFTENRLARIAFAPGVPYDRVEITSVGVADVFVGLRIHEIASRPPVTFTGGLVAGGVAGTPVSGNILLATANSSPSLPGFSIACGAPADYTYSLFEVDQSGARTLAGTLPPSFVLNPNGTLSGNPELDEDGTYSFEVQALNSFGQTAVATFVVTVETNLPVTLVKFEAMKEGSTAVLSWSTSSEVNSDRFEIERSQTGKNWAKIGAISSHRDSKSMNYYSFVDSKPVDGQNLYRLKMVDLDETFAYSHLENVNFSSSAYLYPNPVNGTENLNFNTTDWSSVKLVRVLNASGKTVFETSNALSSGINTKNLAAGFYFVKVIHIDGTTSTHKFVRN